MDGKGLIEAIRGAALTREDVQAAFRALKAKSNALALAEAAAFLPGDKVRFVARRAEWTGVVVQANVKTVSVDCGGMRWKVSPSLLRKA